MTRTILTAALALLFSLTTAMADSARKGPGCWRSQTTRKKAASRMATQKPTDTEELTCYRGQKKGLVILCEFTDKQFVDGHDRDKYLDILNTAGYTTNEGFRGSVADYFRDQSAGLFEPHFDVVGPYTTANDYKYYGQNDQDDLDLYPHKMIIEMCKAADGDVNFADYDWDGDGFVDEVFVVYAGKGESDTNQKNTIWPHMWTLEEAEGSTLTLDGVEIDVYACANELKSSGRINGIGTFCHEFSHCLGLPDFYDIYYTGGFGMDDFDVMAGGSYGGNGFCPVGYTAYEKLACGWQQPIVLGSEDVTVDSLKPMNEHGETYIIYNDAYPDEYYLIENRQQEGWDADYPDRGLLITHVDYDEEVWFNNIPNSVISDKAAKKDGLTCGNDHQRMTLFHADNDDKYLGTDLYPYYRNDSLSATSKPGGTLYHKNSEGTKLMQGAILDIKQNLDGTVAFHYRAPKQPVTDGIGEVTDRSHSNKTIYTLDGRVAGPDIQSLRHGIYLIDGKKVVR